ncbi:MAG TPA: AraC family transcriptional regulator [Alphaproteobacteria bacterium]|nr:AraC family transcriptional regulator [Alphaproteobacteria bacterium]
MSLRTGLGGGKLTGMSSTDIDSPGPPRRHIAVLAFPDVEPVDAVGPIDIFASAGSDWDGRASRAYATELLAPEAGPVKSFTGLSLVADRAFAEVDPGELDTLIVAGGPGVWAAVHDAALIDWLAAAQGRVRRLCSVCSGAFLLAAAGLLDGRRATTHWRWCGELARRHPAVTVEPDLIWVRDGDIYTSAGVTAGMDLALALVEEDLGRAAAMAVARAKVMFLKRPGGQSQYSMALRAQSAAEPPLQALQDWIRDNLGRPLRC